MRADARRYTSQKTRRTEWDEEALDRLQSLCVRGLPMGDIQKAMGEIGGEQLFVGLRTLVQALVRRNELVIAYMQGPPDNGRDED